MNDPLSRLHDLYAATFSGQPQVVCSAPGRVNLIGEHTDYNGGDVLPIAIGQRTWVAVGPGNYGESRAVSDREPGPQYIQHSRSRRSGQWSDYALAIVRELSRIGISIPPFHLAVVSDVPVGAGLSSSAALEVAITIALVELAGRVLPPTETALLGNRAENEFIGVQSGIMDQFVCALARAGNALYLQCDTLATEHVPMPDHVLIFDTRVPRSLRDSAYNARRSECEAALALLRRSYPDLPDLAAVTTEQLEAARLPDALNRRALHVSSETRRVGEVMKVLRSGGAIPGDVLLASHESLRELYDCSSPELDWFVEHAMTQAGVSGARLTGAGWGGCAIAVGDSESLAELAAGVTPAYLAAFHVEPRVWITRASPGAALVDS